MLVIGLFIFVIYNMAAPQLRPLLAQISAIKRDMFAWMVGSQGQYTDYLAVAIGSSVFVWVTLWLMNRLRV